jgi:hypothetical protein
MHHLVVDHTLRISHGSLVVLNLDILFKHTYKCKRRSTSYYWATMKLQDLSSGYSYIIVMKLCTRMNMFCPYPQG